MIGKSTGHISGGSAEPLIGRRAEVGRIEGLLRFALDGDRGLLISGEAGTGKSALLRRAAESAVPDAQVISAAGSRAEEAMPFSGLNQVLRPLMTPGPGTLDGPSATLAGLFGEGKEDMPRWSGSSASGSSAAVSPAARSSVPTSAPDSSDGAALIALAAAATARLLAGAAAERPLLVVIDDAHWLDDASHHVLAAAWRELAAERVALIAARRPGRTGPLSEAGLAELSLGPLTEPESRELLRRSAALPAGPRLERVVRAAAGNPLALGELARAWAGMPDPLEGAKPGDPLTARLRDAFADRLEGLPGRVRDLLLVVAVHDDDRLAAVAEATAVLAAAPCPPDEIAHTVSVAERRGILNHVADPDGAPRSGGDRGDRLVFSHPLLPAIVLDAEPLARVQAAHAAVAACLGPADTRALWHRALAVVGPDEGLAAELNAMADAAAGRADYPTAAAVAERSAALTGDAGRRIGRMLTAAAHCAELGRRDAVDRLLGEAARGPAGILERARMELLTLDVGAGAGDPAVVGHLRALALASAALGEADLGWHLLAASALRCWRADAGDAARTGVAEAAGRLAAISSPDTRHHPGRLLTLALADPINRCAEVLSVLEGIGPREVAAAGPRTVAAWGMAARAVGAYRQAAQLLERATSDLREQGRYGGLALISAMHAGSLVAEGFADDAAAVAKETLRISERTGQPAWPIGSHTVVGLAAALAGDAETATRTADELALDPTASRQSLLHALICQIRGVALMSQGRHGEAYALLRRVFDPESAAHHATGRISALAHLAEAAAHCGAVADARTVVDEMAAVYRVAPAPSLRAQILVAEAFLADDERTADVCEAALATAGLPEFARARIELVLGRWLRRNRRVAASREPLGSAVATFDRLGTRPWADRARAELRAAGQRSGDRPATSAAQDAVLDLLSPQERQIALLIAEGLTNRQIGERLNIAPRTVGSHLYRIFPKLGITSRGQMAGRLAGPANRPAGE